MSKHWTPDDVVRANKRPRQQVVLIGAAALFGVALAIGEALLG